MNLVLEKITKTKEWGETIAEIPRNSTEKSEGG